MHLAKLYFSYTMLNCKMLVRRRKYIIGLVFFSCQTMWEILLRVLHALQCISTAVTLYSNWICQVENPGVGFRFYFEQLTIATPNAKKIIKENNGICIKNTSRASADHHSLIICLKHFYKMVKSQLSNWRAIFIKYVSNLA